MSDRADAVLGELLADRLGTVDPSKFPDEVFTLYSVPSFDARVPEVVPGSSIGSSKQLVQAGDVLLSKIVPHLRRAWVVSAHEGTRIIASSEWLVFRSGRFDAQYLRHSLISDAFHAHFMQTVSGVGGSLLRARPSHVATIHIALPPIADQRRIAAILDQADALRTKRREAIAKLDTLAQAIFLEMFGDLTTNTRGWPVATVVSFCKLVRGSSPRPQGDPRYFGGPIPRLMIADITRDGLRVTPRIDSLTLEGARRSRPVPAGTVVMAVSGNIGLVSQLSVNACIHDGFVAFTNLDESKCEAAFLLALLHYSKALHEKHRAGAIFTNITTTDIRSLKLPLPVVELRHDFLRRMVQLDQLRELHRESLRLFEKVFLSAQHRAFFGSR